MDLHKSGSSLGAISKCLKEPRSSVQTILRKYKQHGNVQPSINLLRNETGSVSQRLGFGSELCVSTQEQRQKTLWRWWLKLVCHYPQWNECCTDMDWKAALPGALPLLKKKRTHTHKKQFANAHREKYLNFGGHVLWSGIMTTVTFGGKRGSLQVWEHHTNCETWWYQQMGLPNGQWPKAYCPTG